MIRAVRAQSRVLWIHHVDVAQANTYLSHLFDVYILLPPGVCDLSHTVKAALLIFNGDLSFFQREGMA